MYTDETLTCTDCSAPFTFSSGEQEFFANKGFQNKPARCPDCRAARKSQKGGGARGAGGPREMHVVTCTDCGQQAEVPFMPRGDKPVYCSDCFQKSRASAFH
ncbi:MAG: zinc-ribbon domain containing protein [Candidatus Eremiobacteraeota bacterium]|nr:zinc-ribbon domain containing protein [Candidatus Eremiobacteraeota bacterium]